MKALMQYFNKGSPNDVTSSSPLKLEVSIPVQIY